jgi:hypothetical protein
MGSARQSPEMAMKNHQKPIPFVIFKMMAAPLAVRKSESNSGFSCPVIHCDYLVLRVTPALSTIFGSELRTGLPLK